MLFRSICIRRRCNFRRSNSLVASPIRFGEPAKSICANLAEGFGKQRQSNLEFKRYLLMAIGSADEMQVWLRYCADLEYVDRKTCERWRDEYRQIARMLQRLATTWRARSDH